MEWQRGLCSISISLQICVVKERLVPRSDLPPLVVEIGEYELECTHLKKTFAFLESSTSIEYISSYVVLLCFTDFKSILFL